MALTSRIIPPLPITERGFPYTGASSADGTLVYCSGTTIVVIPPNDTLALVNHHTAKTTAVAISPSGSWIASGDIRGTVKIWASRGERIQKYEYKVISTAVRGLCWSPDSRRICVVGGDSQRGAEGSCIVFDTGSAVGPFVGHAKAITCVAYRPVAPFRVLTGSEDTSVVFHEGPPFKFMESCKTSHTGFVNAVGFSPDGSKAFSCGSDGIVAVYTGDTGDQLSVLDPKLSCSIWGLSVVSNDKLAIACGDKHLRILSDALAIQSEIPIGQGELKDMPVGISSDLKAGVVHVITLDGKIRSFADSSVTPHRTISGSQGAITCILPYRDNVAVSSADGCVWLLAKPYLNTDPVSIACKNPIKTSAGLLMDGVDLLGVSAGNDGELLNVKTGDTKKVLATPSGTSRLYPCRPVGYALGEKSCRTQRVDHASVGASWDAAVTAFAVSADGETTVAVLEKDRSNSMALQQEKRTFLVNKSVTVATEITTGDIVNVAVSPDGSLIAVASALHELHVYKRTPTGQLAYELIPATMKSWTYHRGRIASMFWIDNRYLLTGGLDKAVYAWDSEKAMAGPVVNMKDSHKEGVTVVTGIRLGDMVTIVSGGAEGSVRITQVELKQAVSN